MHNAPNYLQNATYINKVQVALEMEKEIFGFLFGVYCNDKGVAKFRKFIKYSLVHYFKLIVQVKVFYVYSTLIKQFNYYIEVMNRT